MMKIVVREYFNSFTRGSRSEKIRTILCALYFVIVAPLIGGYAGRVEHMVIYISVAVPTIVILMNSCTMRMPKIMYLIPMSLQERKKYIVKYVIFSIVAGVIIGLLGAIVLLAAGLCSVWMLLLLVYNYIVLKIVMIEVGNGRLESVRWIFSFVVILSLNIIVTALCRGMDTQIPMFVTVSLLILALVLELPAVVKCISCWRKAVTENLNYEAGYSNWE